MFFRQGFWIERNREIEAIYQTQRSYLSITMYCFPPLPQSEITTAVLTKIKDMCEVADVNSSRTYYILPHIHHLLHMHLLPVCVRSSLFKPKVIPPPIDLHPYRYTEKKHSLRNRETNFN